METNNHEVSRKTVQNTLNLFVKKSAWENFCCETIFARCLQVGNRLPIDPRLIPFAPDLCANSYIDQNLNVVCADLKEYLTLFLQSNVSRIFCLSEQQESVLFDMPHKYAATPLSYFVSRFWAYARLDFVVAPKEVAVISSVLSPQEKYGLKQGVYSVLRKIASRQLRFDDDVTALLFSEVGHAVPLNNHIAPLFKLVSGRVRLANADPYSTEVALAVLACFEFANEENKARLLYQFENSKIYER